MRKPTRKEISEYQRRTIEKRWKAARERAARGEIPPEAKTFKPRGPMPDNMRIKGHVSTAEHKIRRAVLVNAALRGDHLTPTQINKMVGKKKRTPRLYINYGEKRPQKFRLRYDKLTRYCVKQIREEFGL